MNVLSGTPPNAGKPEATREKGPAWDPNRASAVTQDPQKSGVRNVTSPSENRTYPLEPVRNPYWPCSSAGLFSREVLGDQRRPCPDSFVRAAKRAPRDRGSSPNDHRWTPNSTSGKPANRRSDRKLPRPWAQGAISSAPRPGLAWSSSSLLCFGWAGTSTASCSGPRPR
jgi:hypothetical protein